MLGPKMPKNTISPIISTSNAFALNSCSFSSNTTTSRKSASGSKSRIQRTRRSYRFSGATHPFSEIALMSLSPGCEISAKKYSTPPANVERRRAFETELRHFETAL